jgi:NAD(P) transhydrogenase
MLFDLIVIGSGPAGQRAAMQAAKVGKKVAIVESCDELGGGCVHYGTLPSKSFRESVYRWSLSSKGPLSRGIAPNGHVAMGNFDGELPGKVSSKVRRPDMSRLLRRKDRVVAGEADVVRDQLRRNGVKIYHGFGKLVSPNDVEVESRHGRERLTATFIFLAVGARPVAPSHLTVDGKHVLDSDSILNLKRIPKKLVVLGAGIIGCEYASIFATAGSKVYLVDRRHEILASVDREIVNHLVDRFTSQGVEVILEAEALEINDKRRVKLSNGRRIQADAVLIALGRWGNTEKLGLENVGIETDNRGLIPVDRYFRTVVPSIYAVGDVVGPPALASTGMEEGRVACCHAFGIEQVEMPQLFPYGIYTIPEISMMGATEEDLVARKIDYVVGKAYYRELARGQIIGDHWGLLKILVDQKTHKILGLHIVGDSAANLIHIGQAVMALGGDIHYFIHTVFNYPTLAEAYKTAAFHAVNQIKGRPASGVSS